MKAVILAAGKGTRLKFADPKPLTPLASGKCILEDQIEKLKKYVELSDILVVVGFQKEKILKQFPDLSYVFNSRYAVTNTAKSLELALKKCFGDVLWLNGDVVFQEAVLKKLLSNPRTGMVVNTAHVGEEEVKYRQDRQGHILEVSKQVKNPQGEAVGINFFAADDLKFLKTALKQCSDADYFERGIEYCIKAGMPVWSVPVPEEMCVEIDFPEDLIQANKLF